MPPPRRERLSRNITFRVTPSAAIAYREAARDADMSLGDWIRSHLPVETRSTGRPSPGSPVRGRRKVDVDPELMREVAAIGNNINQLAKVANRDNLAGIGSDNILDYLSRLTAIERHLATLLERHIP